jgi:hypothetical protein
VRSPGCAGELQRTYAVILVANRNECLTMSYSCLVDGSGRRMNVRDAQLRTCESWVVLPIVMGSAFGFHVWCCSSEDRLAVVVEKRTLRGIHRFEVVREKGTQPAYVSVTIVVSKRTMMRSFAFRALVLRTFEALSVSMV